MQACLPVGRAELVDLSAARQVYLPTEQVYLPTGRRAGIQNPVH
jgi:hypothetical protein